MASLAVANRPDAMNFVLVDYKGGAAFKDCVDLPHTVGMVTDLDTHLVERALTSLGAELTHREHLLAAAGAKDLEDYLDYATRRPELAPIPRLLIVIDEFASMARELPDFVTGLVNVAQRGRSLGIHLILATQRPVRRGLGGDPRQHQPAGRAAGHRRRRERRRHRRPGGGEHLARRTRARVRTAGAQLAHPVPDRPGRRPPPAAGPARPRWPAPFLHPVGWLDLGRPVPQRPRSVAETDEATDLSVLVSAIRQANDMLGLPAQRRPVAAAAAAVPGGRTWPAEPAPATTGASPSFSWALQDLPEAQQQEPLTIDLATFGHLHIVGAPALRPLAGAADHRRRRGRRRRASPTCTCTDSTAATARCCR